MFPSSANLVGFFPASELGFAGLAGFFPETGLAVGLVLLALAGTIPLARNSGFLWVIWSFVTCRKPFVTSEPLLISANTAAAPPAARVAAAPAGGGGGAAGAAGGGGGGGGGAPLAGGADVAEDDAMYFVGSRPYQPGNAGLNAQLHHR